jgi:HSP20 family molecular chaperone IbpA
MATPSVDIYENADEFLVLADVPGARPDEVAVQLENDQLSVQARGADPRDYARTFVVPRGIDASRITAEMKQGVLHLHLPKSDALKPRKIQVRASA